MLLETLTHTEKAREPIVNAYIVFIGIQYSFTDRKV